MVPGSSREVEPKSYSRSEDFSSLHPIRYKQSKRQGDSKNKYSERCKRNINCAGEIYDGGLQLKLARTRTEVLSVGQCLKDGASGVDTREGDSITAPVDFNALLLQSEEDNQYGNSDSAGEGSGGDAENSSAQNSQSDAEKGYSLVVLGPPTKITSPDVVIEGVGDRDCGPSVGQVIRCPSESTKQEDGNMEVSENLELLAEEVEGDGQDSTQGETPQEAIVSGIRSEHLFGAESTPEDGSREKLVVQGTSEAMPLRGQAEVGDLCHLVIENGRADEGGDESCPHLAVEGDPRSDVRVVGDLETLSEVESLRGREGSVRLEVVHSGGITREPETTEELGNNVRTNLDVRDG